MKLKRSTLAGTAAAAVGAAALAGGLAVATAPAHASTSSTFPFTVAFKVCDHLSTKAGHISIDVWNGGIFGFQVSSGTCHTQHIPSPVNGTVQLFLDGKGVEISQVTFVNGDPITDTVTGTHTDVHQAITINN